jgi:heme exporter protein C
MHRFANPAQFARLSAVLLPIAAAVTLGCAVFGLYYGLVVAPDDYQQGAMVKVMYIHVPAAIMASMVYGFMAVMSASFLIWRHSLADVLAREAAPIGAVFTLICLVTGMLWGKPTWGAYWVWDARLTSMLILLLLYAGYLALASSGDHAERVKVACAWLALIGSINLPIIRYSVEWWNSLHQGQSLNLIGKSSVDPSMLFPLQLMIVAFVALFITLLLVRADTALKATKLRRLQIQRIALKNAAIGE